MLIRIKNPPRFFDKKVTRRKKKCSGIDTVVKATGSFAGWVLPYRQQLTDCFLSLRDKIKHGGHFLCHANVHCGFHYSWSSLACVAGKKGEGRRGEERGGRKASPIPLLFPFLPIPYPFHVRVATCTSTVNGAFTSKFDGLFFIS